MKHSSKRLCTFMCLAAAVATMITFMNLPEPTLPSYKELYETSVSEFANTNDSLDMLLQNTDEIHSGLLISRAKMYVDYCNKRDADKVELFLADTLTRFYRKECLIRSEVMIQLKWYWRTFPDLVPTVDSCEVTGNNRVAVRMTQNGVQHTDVIKFDVAYNIVYIRSFLSRPNVTTSSKRSTISR